MSTKEKPGYYAVIPSAVRYCDKIPASAKLLYGELSALSNACGYCWASDQYFADLYDTTLRTVRNLLGALQDAHFIIIQEEKTVDGRKMRKVLLNPVALVIAQENAPERLEKIFQPSENNFPTLEKIFQPSEKIFPNMENFFQRIYCNNNTSNNIPPITPQTITQDQPSITTQGQPSKQARKPSEPKHRPDWFGELWKFYSNHARNPGNRQRAVRAWDKLAPDEELVQKMCAALRRQIKTDWWQKDIGVPHFSTWLNNAWWENPINDDSGGTPEETPQREGWN